LVNLRVAPALHACEVGIGLLSVPKSFVEDFEGFDYRLIGHHGLDHGWSAVSAARAPRGSDPAVAGE